MGTPRSFFLPQHDRTIINSYHEIKQIIIMAEKQHRLWKFAFNELHTCTQINNFFNKIKIKKEGKSNRLLDFSCINVFWIWVVFFFFPKRNLDTHIKKSLQKRQTSRVQRLSCTKNDRTTVSQFFFFVFIITVLSLLISNLLFNFIFYFYFWPCPQYAEVLWARDRTHATAATGATAVATLDP